MNLSEKLANLAADLSLIEREQGPTAEELEQAPLLLNWRLAPGPVMALEGLVLDHPKLGTDQICTSMVYYLDRNARWARTLSRYYRLDASKQRSN